ncbi:MAG: hypothetical protein ACOY46_14800 [Bacillota bacterium]
MSDLTIRLEPAIDHKAMENLKTSLSRIHNNDQITIIMESTDAHQADKVMELLRNEGFDFQPRGSHDGRDYQVIARRAGD